MSQYTIYHNPRCSKSRQTLAILEENNIQPEIILYLETPPSSQELRHLLALLGLSARDLLRKSEDAYKQHNLADLSLSEADIIAAMVSSPKLIERPIVVNNNETAVLGRPPENVLALI